MNHETQNQFKNLTDEELLEILKQSPDFTKFVFPTYLHKKFPDLPKADCANPKEFIAESAWTKKAYHYYADGGKVLEIQPNPEKQVVILPAPEIPIEIRTEPAKTDAID